MPGAHAARSKLFRARHRADRHGPEARRVLRDLGNGNDGRGDLHCVDLAREIPEAMRRNEFIPWYQPLINLADGRLIGVEALARWDHRRYGVLEPGMFINIAEANGVIVQLGMMLLRQACRDAAAWNAIRPGFYVSVNLAGAQISDPNLCRAIDDALNEARLPRRLLQLEVTETTPVYDDPIAVRNIVALTASGMRVAIDDFGTGYSNLDAVRLPYTDLKIPQEIVQIRSHDSVEPHPVLAYVTDIARRRGMNMTAEGIETEAQRRQVRRLGCQTGQGWLFGKAAPAGTITYRLAAELRSADVKAA